MIFLFFIVYIYKFCSFIKYQNYDHSNKNYTPNIINPNPYQGYNVLSAIYPYFPYILQLIIIKLPMKQPSFYRSVKDKFS